LAVGAAANRTAPCRLNARCGAGVVAPDSLTTLSMNDAGDGENFIQIITGVTALAAGLLSVGQSVAQAKRSGPRV